MDFFSLAQFSREINVETSPLLYVWLLLCCKMESPGHNLFSLKAEHAVSVANMDGRDFFCKCRFWCIGSGFGSLHPTAGHGGPQHVWRSKYCNKFFTSLSYLSCLHLTWIYTYSYYIIYICSLCRKHLAILWIIKGNDQMKSCEFGFGSHFMTEY